MGNLQIPSPLAFAEGLFIFYRARRVFERFNYSIYAQGFGIFCFATAFVCVRMGMGQSSKSCTNHFTGTKCRIIAGR